MNAEIAKFLAPFSLDGGRGGRKRSLLILGAGVTGIALADLLADYKIPFSLYDQNLLPLKKIQDWKPYLENTWDRLPPVTEALSNFTDILLSPGYPRKDPWVVTAEKQIRVWNDFDFFYPLLEQSGKTLIAVTGTDGKSTTVELIRHLLGDAALACGNNDVPLARVLEDILSPTIDQVVIEFSSFMLEKLYRFRADYSMILNIAPDHLDRYESFSDYVAAKHRLLAYTRPSDTYLHNCDDPETFPHNPIPRVIDYGIMERRPPDPIPEYNRRRGRYYHNDILIWEGETSVILFPENIFPALIISQELNLTFDLLHSRLQSFSGLPHRLEKVETLNLGNGKTIYIYNNSKATTLQAVMTSIDYLYDYHQTSIHVILGGKSKNTDFTPLCTYRDKVKAYFYGEAGETIREQSKLSGDYIYSLKECVNQSLANLQKDLYNSDRGVLILSPGCTSFDQFANYRERGDYFKRIIREQLSQNTE